MEYHTACVIRVVAGLTITRTRSDTLQDTARCMDLDVLSPGTVFESQTNNRDMKGARVLYYRTSERVHVF
jgi:hypothetical protein